MTESAHLANMAGVDLGSVEIAMLHILQYDLWYLEEDILRHLRYISGLFSQDRIGVFVIYMCG